MTLVESTPGSFELQGLGPIAIAGGKIVSPYVRKIVTPASINSVASTVGGVTTYCPKPIGASIIQTKSATSTPISKNTTTVLDDSD